MIAPENESGEIHVSSKTLGHISSGIYRSTAGALKELISNAFDADASAVRIATNPPSFNVVSVTDNGTGIEFNKFVALMKSQIGDSDKRQYGDRTPGQRPIIGRIGIGLLAIAQICHTFEVVSHHRTSKTAFRARVHLIDYLRPRIDKADAADDEYNIGHFDAQRIEFDQQMAGTKIVASELKHGFVTRFRQKSGARLPSTFTKFFSEATKHNSLRELSPYWRTAWDIALAAPLPYLGDSPIRDEDVEQERQSLLTSFGFDVYFDGLKLFRPVLLPPRKSDVRLPEDRRLFPLRVNRRIEGQELVGEGYLYSQGGKSIYPAELRGVLIRIKNVAIGTYDRNFLDYPVVEGPRLSWLSGELNIDSGLEDALNIDRDSFNETHPHYLAVQQLIHSAMDAEVRPWLYRNLDTRKRAKVVEAEKEAASKATDAFSPYFSSRPKVERVQSRRVRGSRDNTMVPALPVTVDEERSVIQIDETAPWPRPRRDRELAQRMAIAFELALKAGDPQEIRRVFYGLLQQVF